jgi:C-terminal peptidase prc
VVTGDSAIDRFSRFSAGDSGKASDIRLLTPDGVKTYRIIREPVAFPTVYVDSIGGVGYIAITGFMPSTIGKQTTATEFKSALAATKRFSTTILDLRDNGGGSLDLTTKMCDEILPAGEVIIRQQQRQFSEEDHVPLLSMVHHMATSGGTAEKRKFVLMGNGRSASAAEIFLVALKEGIGAPLVGQRTYGKGVGQNVRSTPGKGLALVTFLKFMSRNNLDYHKHGLEPDVADTATGDRLLLRAVEVAKGLGKTAKTAKAGAGGGVDEALADEARRLEWNRMQGVIPGVRELETDL